MKKAISLMLTMFILGLACASCDPVNNDKETESGTRSEVETKSETESQTETETTVETETETEIEVETTIPTAGMDSGIVRDGTPKKYITIRFDDCTTQDIRIIEMFKQYNLDCATFYINTGLLGVTWEWVGNVYNTTTPVHTRLNREQIETGIYDGFDVAVHTLSHTSLKNLSKREVAAEVTKDAANIENIFGYKPVGMAWPGGDTEWTEDTVRYVKESTDIRFGICTTATNSFDLPEHFLTWYPTCAINSYNSLSLLQSFLNAELGEEDMLYFAWGHGYEFDLSNCWNTLDRMLSMISEAAAEDDSIVLVTNSEFYQLFKDEIPS